MYFTLLQVIGRGALDPNIVSNRVGIFTEENVVDARPHSLYTSLKLRNVCLRASDVVCLPNTHTHLKIELHSGRDMSSLRSLSTATLGISVYRYPFCSSSIGESTTCGLLIASNSDFLLKHKTVAWASMRASWAILKDGHHSVLYKRPQSLEIPVLFFLNR